MGNCTTIKTSLRLSVGVILATTLAFGADFLHPPHTLEIHSETVLSGIDLYNSKIDEIVEKLGKPSQVTVTARTDVSETRRYEWQTKMCSLRLTTVELRDGRKWIESIDVLGTHPDDEVGVTGRGLKLGDVIGDLRRIYSLREYFGATLPENDSPLQVSARKLSGAILNVDFDKTGRVNHMKLAHSCMPPCW